MLSYLDLRSKFIRIFDPLGRPRPPKSAAPLSVPRRVKTICFNKDVNTCCNMLYRGGPARPKDQRSSQTASHVGPMLAPFFALGRFLGAFCASCCVCCRFWLVFMRLGALLLDFGKFRKGPGRVLEAPKPYFARLFCPRTHAMRKKPDRRFVLKKPIRNACRPSSACC